MSSKESLRPHLLSVAGFGRFRKVQECSSYGLPAQVVDTRLGEVAARANEETMFRGCPGVGAQAIIVSDSKRPSASNRCSR